MFGLFVATGILLFFSCKLGIDDWVDSYRGPLITGFIVSGAILLTSVGSAVYPSCAYYVKDKRKIHLAKKHLNQLTEDEKIVCRHFVEKNGQSYRTVHSDGPVATLLLNNRIVRKQIVQCGKLCRRRIGRDSRRMIARDHNRPGG